MNRVFDSSGPEGKVRGTPQQIIEKYNQLARDALLSGDRVATENFQQHAEHYLRLLGVAQKEVDAKREVQERENRERQAERDRDRERSQERVRRQERESSGPTSGPSGGGDLSESPQPDLIETGGADSGLVITPENQTPAPQPAPSQPASPRPKRSRKPRAEQPPVQNDAGDAAAAPAPEDKAGSGNPEAAE